MGIVISGGASGIGLACAQHFAKAGHQVAILDLNPSIQEALKALPGSGHSAHAVNVCDSAAVEEAIASISANWPITGLVISAGIVSQTPLLEITAQEFSKVLDVNVTGVQNVIAPVARGMVAAAVKGSIVVLGSVAAFNGGGFMGRGAYAASKAAVLGLSRSYSRELAPAGIRINVVAPGATETPMTQALDAEKRAKIMAQMPNGSFLDSSEIVNAINFLISDDASAINGQTLHANGGSYFG